MRKIFLSLCFSIVFLNFLFSQDLKYQYGENLTVSMSEPLIGLLHSDESSYYLGFQQNLNNLLKDVRLVKLDSNLNVVFSKRFDSKAKRESLGLFYFKGRFLFIETKRLFIKKSYQVFVTEIDLSGKIIREKELMKLHLEGRDDFPDAVCEISPDGKKLVVFIKFNPRPSKTKFRSYFSAFDRNLKPIVRREIELNLRHKDVKLNDYAYTQDNKVYLLAEIADAKQVNKFNSIFSKVAYNPFIISVDKEDIMQFPLQKDGNFLEDFGMQYNHADSMLYAYALISYSKNGPSVGLNVIKFQGLSGNVVYDKENYFTKDQLSFYGKTLSQKVGDKEIAGLHSDFFAHDFIFNQNSELTILCEKTRARINELPSHSIDSPGIKTTKYHTKSTFAISIDENGEISKTSLIPKNFFKRALGEPQRKGRVTHIYNMFSFVDTVGANYRYIYNDRINDYENQTVDLSKYEKPAKYKNSQATLAYFDSEGILIRKTIFEGKDQDFIVLPRFTKRLGPDKYFLLLSNRTLIKSYTFRFAILEIK